VRRAPRIVAGAGVALALSPAAASAHGIAGRTDLPIPSWMFGWAAAIVLIASFAALGALWPRPRLQHVTGRPLFRLPRAVDAATGALGVAVFVVVVYAGFRGSTLPTANLATTFIYVHFWVGTVVASLLLGDVFRALSPWRALARAAAPLTRRLGNGTRPWPGRLGRWPAVLTIGAFAWLELAATDRDDPRLLAVLALGYAGIQLAGMARFGIETWTDRGDGFAALFSLYARLAPLHRRPDGVVEMRPPLAGAPSLTLLPGTGALILVAIGSTTFDGFSNGPVWASLGPDLTRAFGHLGLSPIAGAQWAATVGLIGCIALVASLYGLGTRGMASVDGRRSPHELGERFVHTLIPIAAAYAIAHYFSLLAYQGQALGYLMSDPLGNGSNLFGTASLGIDYSVIGAKGIWYVQVVALIAGHVGALVLAHDKAVATYRDVRRATRSQYWMLAVMVGFTSLGLWLLSAIST
jgi:hypothetical protein